MAHLYPLAQSADEALAPARPTARTRYDAERLANGTPVEALQTDWLGHDALPATASEASITAARSAGFVQVYEDEDGAPTYAVTYWLLQGPIGDPVEVEAEPPAPRPPRTPKPETITEDHTDDLYFRAGRTRAARRRRRYVDPRQLDLFLAPDQRGYEHADPNNPNVMLNDEEGDGTTFGG